MMPMPMPMSDDVKSTIKQFPSRSDQILLPGSYVHHVYHYLLQCKYFLEIGYYKGLFVEICKTMGKDSIHIDISNKKMQSAPTKKNICITEDSKSYLARCEEKFDLIFQDGSKHGEDRYAEYKLIAERDILLPGGTILSDDLHYPACRNAFDRSKNLGYEISTVRVIGRKGKNYNFGILTI